MMDKDIKEKALQDVRETVSNDHLELVSLVTELSNEDLPLVRALVERLLTFDGWKKE